MNDAKTLGLQARAFKLSRSGRQRPSNELLFLWFVGRMQLVRKADVQAFDVWLRSEDGVRPYPNANGLQNSIFPSGYERRASDSAASLQWFVYEVQPKYWALTVGGHLELRAKADKLPW